MSKKNLLAVIICCLPFNNVFAENIHIVKGNEDMQWINMPNSVGKYVVLAGNPKKKEFFVVRVKFPANHSIYPHYHHNNEYDTLISGSCYIAKGKVHEKKNGMLAVAGDFVTIPANLPHYGWTGDEGAVIQISGMGPWNPIYAAVK